MRYFFPVACFVYARILFSSKASSKEIIFEYPLLKVESISSATFFLNSPNRYWPTLPMNGVSNQPPRPQEKPKDLVSVVGFLSSPPYI